MRNPEHRHWAIKRSPLGYKHWYALRAMPYNIFLPCREKGMRENTFHVIFVVENAASLQICDSVALPGRFRDRNDYFTGFI